ncbi:MAG: hypothetical protein EXR30_01570 [Betaproteobacteria bacterium]|nr:hypothetical protein [Betaproteobacteria bacterium]MSQ88373.1 hypothetical protein [Betaproteobacteria bacterium]
MKKICFVLAACVAGSTAAQAAARPDPAEPKAAVPVRPYESAFKNYQPYVDPDIARWREVNDEVGRLNGHMGHLPRQPGSAAKPGAKPPVQDEHRGHK